MKPLYLIKNVHGRTVDLLGNAIISGAYAVGASLPPEPLLCEQLGVSRTVVREAVKSLVAKGLLITGPKLGTRVLPEDQWNWFDPDVISWQSQNGCRRPKSRSRHTRATCRDGRISCAAGQSWWS